MLMIMTILGVFGDIFGFTPPSAEREPPYFDSTNPMAALYQVASNDAPRLTGGVWSDQFRDFVAYVLQKDVGSYVDFSTRP